MRIIIKRKVLLEGLNVVSKSVSINSPIQVLTGIKFIIDKEGMTLIGSDSDISIKTFIPKSEDNLIIFNTGKFVLQSKYINELIKKIEGDKVEIELVEDNLIKINDHKTNVNLNTIFIDDYPLIDFDLNQDYIKLKGSNLKNLINQTIFATSNKETRPILTGVNFKLDGNIIEVVATDSYRLARKQMVNNENLFYNMTIPSKSLQEINKIINEKDEIKIYFYEKKVMFSFENTIISTRLINGNYPDTSKLIPNDFKNKLELLRNDFLLAIERASLLSSDKNNIVKLRLTKNEAELTSNNREVGYINEKIVNFKYDGDDFEISFSANYVIEALRSFLEEDIQILFNGEMKPFIIKNKKDNNLIQLILPVKTY